MSLPAPYYQDDAVTIYHGDCRDLLADIEADVLVTDPPYGISYNADWQTKVHEGRSARNHGVGTIANDRGEIGPDLFSGWSERVVFGFPYLYDESASGWLVWDKEPGFSGRSLTTPIEMAYSTTWTGFRAVRLLWSGYMRKSGSEPKLGHPTQKPESLMRQVIEWQRGKIIFDPFAGSGTTLKAAKDLGRKAIGIELEERYCEIAAERCSQEVFNLEEAA